MQRMVAAILIAECAALEFAEPTGSSHVTQDTSESKFLRYLPLFGRYFSDKVVCITW